MGQSWYLSFRRVSIPPGSTQYPHALIENDDFYLIKFHTPGVRHFHTHAGTSRYEIYEMENKVIEGPQKHGFIEFSKSTYYRSGHVVWWVLSPSPGQHA